MLRNEASPGHRPPPGAALEQPSSLSHSPMSRICFVPQHDKDAGVDSESGCVYLWDRDGIRMTEKLSSQ
jgi:hypothetical protein